MVNEPEEEEEATAGPIGNYRLMSKILVSRQDNELPTVRTTVH